METEQCKQFLLKEEARAFEGWDFSYLRGRWKNEQIPWDYRKIIKTYLRPHMKLLDMGTGGGEFLLELDHPFSNISVTEGYEPNIEQCMKRLAPLGIHVEKISDIHRIPYNDNLFDIVINRHESYDIAEVWRVLKPNGIFITQQIGKENDMDLIQRLMKGLQVHPCEQCLEYALQEAKEHHFQIVQSDEAFTPIYFYDLGAFVYFAKVIQWEFVGFSVEKHFNELQTMQSEIDEYGYLKGSEHRYILILQK